MSLKCLLVAVLFMSPCVFGRDCQSILDKEDTNVCNECIRCGGKWCSDVSEDLHCVGPQSNDNWCPENQEKLPDPNATSPFSNKGTFFDTLYVEKRAIVGNTAYTNIKILSRPRVKTALRTYYTIGNTTQSGVPDVHIDAKLKDDSILVTTKFGSQFCSPNSTTFEYVDVKVGLQGVNEEILLIYQVPCACGCSDRVEKNSSQCSGLGDLSCGICHCREDRTGTSCERKKCSDRGDNPPTCENPLTKMQCSGNGRCNECNECECFSDIEGSQYLHPDNFCEDLCSATNKCSDCLQKNEPGQCEQCDTAFVSIVEANKTTSEERDQISGRKVWVHCNVTVDCGVVQYAAMQRDGEKHVMILQGCDPTSGAVGVTGITVPVVSTLAAVAVMMAVAGVGYMVWKGKGAAPLPLTSPEYTNIDAEDCTGVNPLYKPPTSSFKNPMYGKS